MNRITFRTFGACIVLISLFMSVCIYAQDEIVYHGRTVDINIVEADVADVLLMLAEASNQNIVIDSDVKNTLTLRLIDVPVDQAIDIILQLSDLEAVPMNGVVVIRSISGVPKNTPVEE